METRGRPITVWCLLRDQFGHVRPVEQWLGERARFVYDADWDPKALVGARPDVVVCVNDFPYDIARCLDAARTAGIPSLVVQDGVLEWRCQYENPLFGAGGGAPQHQPVLADRIACIGDQSARQIAAWGNAGKVEVTGMPRLDHLLDRPRRPPARPGRRILVMTAKKAGFDAAQVAVTLRSLQDVRGHLEQLDGVETLWRVDPELAPMLGIDNRLGRFASGELAEVLAEVDAVISTPSTAVLEAMLMGRPVAVLDYHNVPRFIASAWTISAAEHVPAVVTELRQPQPRKLAFQSDVLADALRIDGPAAPRVGALLEWMAAGPGAPRPAVLDRDGHAVGQGGSRSLADAPALGELYPDEPIFALTDVRELQVRLARLQAENARLRRQLALRRRVAQAARRLLHRLRGRPALAVSRASE